MKKFATVLSWAAVILCFLCLPAFGFHVCNIFFVLAGLLFIPAGRLSRALNEHLKIKPAFIYLIALMFMVIGVFSAPNIAPESGTPSGTSSTASIEATSASSADLQTTVQTTSQATAQTSSQTTTKTTAQTTVQPETPVAQAYILNTSSKKIHYPGCSSAKKISAANKAEHTGDYSALLEQGYTTCGICFK